MKKWRPVVGFEDKYEVSKFGKIRLLRDSTKYKAGYVLQSTKLEELLIENWLKSTD